MAQMQNFRARSATRRLDHTIKCTQRVISNAAIVQHTAEQEELEAATGTSGMGASWTYGRVYDAISELSSDSELELSFAMCLLHVLEGGPVAEAIAAQWVVECAHKYHVALVEDIAKADKVFARICQFTRAAKNAAHGAGLRREKLLMIAAELSK
ncbi:hypothetical protein GGI06_002793 [Coemansia sp. S85]|nr:hypothetical protein GGI06_002793 [Coemansia sp. S85]